MNKEQLEEILDSRIRQHLDTLPALDRIFLYDANGNFLWIHLSPDEKLLAWKLFTEKKNALCEML